MLRDPCCCMWAMAQPSRHGTRHGTGHDIALGSHGMHSPSAASGTSRLSSRSSSVAASLPSPGPSPSSSPSGSVGRGHLRWDPPSLLQCEDTPGHARREVTKQDTPGYSQEECHQPSVGTRESLGQDCPSSVPGWCYRWGSHPQSCVEAPHRVCGGGDSACLRAGHPRQSQCPLGTAAISPVQAPVWNSMVLSISATWSTLMEKWSMFS